MNLLTHSPRFMLTYIYKWLTKECEVCRHKVKN